MIAVYYLFGACTEYSLKVPIPRSAYFSSFQRILEAKTKRRGYSITLHDLPLHISELEYLTYRTVEKKRAGHLLEIIVKAFAIRCFVPVTCQVHGLIDNEDWELKYPI